MGGINFDVTEQMLRQIFGCFGLIKSLSLSLDPAEGRHRGFSFMEFETPEAANLAHALMNGADLNGRWVSRPILNASFVAFSRLAVPVTSPQMAPKDSLAPLPPAFTLQTLRNSLAKTS